MPVTDPIKRREIVRRFHQRHPDYCRQQYLKHKETTRKAYLRDNRAVIATKRAAYRDKNRDELNAKCREKRRTRAFWEKRYIKSLSKAHLNAAPVIDKPVLQAFYKRVFTQDAGICDYCRGVFPVRELVIDHKQPYAKGGIHCVTNLAISCYACNRKKSARSYDAWLSLQGGANWL